MSRPGPTGGPGGPGRPGEPRRLLCHPEQPAAVRGFRARCPACGSFWDLESCAREVRYDEAYAQERRHLEPETGRLKVATLRRWLETVGISARGQVVCEVGFGGGHCLAELARVADEAHGIEVIPGNLRHARDLGIPRARLHLFHELPPRMPRQVSLWIFQDSFEHILEPDPFAAWVGDSSAAGARLLLVAPDAASPSQRWLGRFWPHRVPDHHFHWSAEGLRTFFARHRFELVRRFHPVKRISTAMVLQHLRRTRLARAGRWLGRVAPPVEAWANVGEMGLLFRRA